MADIELDSLVIRDFTKVGEEAFMQAVANGEIGENDLNFTPYVEPAKPDLSNTTDNVDFVVESQEPTSANGYTWYRKYKSGWVEQGGTKTFDKINANAAREQTVSFPVQMADTTYYVAPATFITDAGNSTTLRNYRNTRNTTGLIIGMYTTNTLANTFVIQWMVSGRAAE